MLRAIPYLFCLAAALLLASCAAAPGTIEEPGMARALRPCPPLPNCVCSDASGSMHAIAPLPVGEDADARWQQLRAFLEADPEFTIVEEDDGYLHAEARTKTLGFVDDVELLLGEDGIAVRSASRVGLYDFGTNRRRVERLRRALQEPS